jgi:hypothetical protein
MQIAPSMVEFLLPEDAVAERLGISKDLVRQARGAENGRWGKGAHGRVLWSQEGVESLLAEITPPPAEKAPQPAQAEILVVWNPAVPNRRTLVAIRKGVAPEKVAAEDRCVVYLGLNGDNRRFVIGMEILARHHRGATWNFEGNPEFPGKGRQLPRFTGRW